VPAAAFDLGTDRSKLGGARLTLTWEDCVVHRQPELDSRISSAGIRQLWLPLQRGFLLGQSAVSFIDFRLQACHRLGVCLHFGGQLSDFVPRLVRSHDACELSLIVCVVHYIDRGWGCYEIESQADEGGNQAG